MAAGARRRLATVQTVKRAGARSEKAGKKVGSRRAATLGPALATAQIVQLHMAKVTAEEQIHGVPWPPWSVVL